MEIFLQELLVGMMLNMSLAPQPDLMLNKVSSSWVMIRR